MTVFENIAYGLKIKRIDKAKIREKVEWALKFLGLEGLADRKPSQLSGGQQQRVALARAIVVEPKLLLLDEPLSNLDAKIRLRIRFELKALQQKLGIPTLYVTHDQEEALSIADRVIIIHNGKILQVGTPEEIYRNPSNLFVADFVGVNTIIKVPVKNGVAKIGNVEKRIPNQQKIATVVIRADEVILSTNKNVESGPEDLVLTGVIRGRLYLGSKYRYEMEVDGVNEPVFINHGSDVETGTEVKVVVPKGSYFIF
jgi:ABC-type Fe3+/spermidine/putrescine transport system ATPase subunit